MREPRLTARANPTRLSYADAERTRATVNSSLFLLTSAHCTLASRLVKSTKQGNPHRIPLLVSNDDSIYQL